MLPIRSSIALITMLGAVGCSAAPAAAPDTSVVSVTPPPTPLPELPEGACGGFAGLPRASDLPLLQGRLRISRLDGMEDSARPANIMGPLLDDSNETRLYLDNDEDEVFVIFAVELRARPGSNLARSVHAIMGDGFIVHSLADQGMPAVVAIPDSLDTTGEATVLLHLFTVTADDLVQRTTFYASPGAAQSGGCRNLALDLALSVVPGGRLLREEPGLHRFHRRLGLNVPEGFVLSIREGPHFSVYEIRALAELSRLPASLGIYDGGHPSRIEEAGARRVPGRLFGEDIEWIEREEEGVLRRDVWIPSPGGYGGLHLFARAGDPELMQSLMRAAGSLTRNPPIRPLPACEPSAHLDAPPAPLDDPDHSVLMDASVFTTFEGTWHQPTVVEVDAFRSLLQKPNAIAAFQHLALRARTPEGKLYGLAGLRLADPASFEVAFCALRAELPATARGLTLCGGTRFDVAEALDSNAEDAVRGESFWPEMHWNRAIGHGSLDIRGGGIPMRLFLRPRADRALRGQAMSLLGGGFSPPIDEGVAPPPPLVDGDRENAAAPVVVRYGRGICAVRRDGRLACWGRTPILRDANAGDEEEASLFPEPVRFPADVAAGPGGGCLLDGDGTRLCWGGYRAILEARSEACGSAPPPDAAIISRRFDDGPWESLLATDPICGIRRDGTLHCFGADPTPDLRGWADVDATNLSFAIPIPGRVAGATSHFSTIIAWTEDGEIYSFGRRDPPLRIGHFDGLLGVATGLGGHVFAWLRDGRVLAWGLHDRREWYRHYGGMPIEEWVEIPELRGGVVHLDSYHGCVVYEDGHVVCFGKPDGFSLEEDLPDPAGPTEVPALRGARSLHLGQRRVCGWMDGERLRCVGKEATDATRAEVREGFAERALRGLFRRAREIPSAAR